MRLIDADALLNKKFKYMLHGCDDLLVTVKVQDIENAPTIDAVPVSELKVLRDWFYESDGIAMGNLAMLNKLIEKYEVTK